MWKGRILTATLFTATLFTIGEASLAEEGVVNFSGQDPSEEQIMDALTPRMGPVGKTRGIAAGAIGAGAAAVAPAALTPAKASFDQITFELNSDRISPKARGILDKLGKVLQSDELVDVEYVIEGHTDASGTLDYNMRLSKRRAESVKRYLVESFQIEPSRLKTAGRGPTDLLDKETRETVPIVAWFSWP